ncbi:hypothetical protein MBM_00887 [Drepanopeziza brunnea f. sp. 'multigermtubi' MB_m1]|uniref:Uncharacterized protein n=1 Tax=Marssonina brunnea f. sp. multigermtubi (strain MB_m1) TaxID=1072389 RepID=K1Y9D4_MARBU|nr:uncharacterized protein MBM_00887 [Drepanopeziza brunnea f. sp. 'multigermtubi' MB_m1]EKD21774.1 hypothetical protein MBM_00887 [Drepanopeziza brunnea f. sp. 'multigermtubi' MB_m1]
MSLSQFSEKYKKARVEDVSDATSASNKANLSSLGGLKYKVALSNIKDIPDVNVRMADSKAKKRVRIHRSLDDAEVVEAVKQLTKKTLTKKLRKKKTEEKEGKKLRQLKEIVGREGQRPINYMDLASKFKTTINLLELFQLSLEVSKQFKKLSTKKNLKKKSGLA